MNPPTFDRRQRQRQQRQAAEDRRRQDVLETTAKETADNFKSLQDALADRLDSLSSATLVAADKPLDAVETAVEASKPVSVTPAVE